MVVVIIIPDKKQEENWRIQDLTLGGGGENVVNRGGIERVLHVEVSHF